MRGKKCNVKEETALSFRIGVLLVVSIRELVVYIDNTKNPVNLAPSRKAF